LAKFVANLDQLSHGRVILGVDAGAVSYAAAIGRAHIDRAFSVRVQVQFDEDLGPGSGSKDAIPAGNIGVAADRLKRYQEGGVSHAIFSLETANLDRIRKTMDHIAFRVRPAVE
jgi:hypothetical protein